MNRPRNVILLMALLTILCGSLWLIERGRNEVAITGMPAEKMILAVIDSDDGQSAGQSFTIKDGMVDLGWGYSIKGRRMLVRIRDEAGTHYEGDLVVDPSGTTRLHLPR